MGNQGSKRIEWIDIEIDIPDGELLGVAREIKD